MKIVMIILFFLASALLMFAIGWCLFKEIGRQKRKHEEKERRQAEEKAQKEKMQQAILYALINTYCTSKVGFISTVEPIEKKEEQTNEQQRK